MKNERVYYVSQYDNQIHHINDKDHKIISEKEAYIGKDCGYENGFRVDEEVNLWTVKEVMEFF